MTVDCIFQSILFVLSSVFLNETSDDLEVIAIFEEIVCSKLPSAFFRDLFLWEQARPKAVANYDKYKGEMHSLTATMVGKDLQAAQLGKA